MKASALTLATAIAALGASLPAGASEFDARLKEIARQNIQTWIGDPVIVDAIRAQNAVTSGYSGDMIDRLDKTWRAEVAKADRPTIDPVLKSPAAAFLRARRDASGGLFTEVFVMDARGLNVAASDVTSDYWQGDEAKWQKTFQVGAGAVQIGEVELDESTQTYQAQVSVSIADPATGAVIGAATVGVDVAKLD